MIVGIQDEILKIHAMGLLDRLLADKTTKSHILWATDTYQTQGPEYARDKEITPELITGCHSDVIKNRARKALEQQLVRTRQRGEVFTPLWVCAKMNDELDNQWFGKENVFFQDGRATEHVPFPKRRKWQHYIDNRRMELTCGEAPYLVSRYDAATGESIPLRDRIGILDRKLRVVNENTTDEAEWLEWVIRAYQATYGFEFQGDNLLIARVNLLMTFEEYLQARWHRIPTPKEYQTFANIITWNLWQMDGLTGALPYCRAKEEYPQMSLFEWSNGIECFESANAQLHCRIFDWRRKRSLEYKEVNTGGKNMKFSFIIGNPPYQEETLGDNKGFAPPIYHKFMESVFGIADAIELVHPARFLFNAGSTPKTWNEKMLNDEHFKVLFYESDASKLFPNTDIKGGIVFSYYSQEKDFGAIEVFTKHIELNCILHKVIKSDNFSPLSTIVITRTAYRLTDTMHNDHPEALGLLSKGHAYDMSTNIFDRLPQIFHEEKPQDGHSYISILGRKNNERVFKFIRRDYVNSVKNLDKYKIFIPKANGVGSFGEILSSPIIAEPGQGSTETFLSIGVCDTLYEAESILKYIKGKFARALLGIQKTTQDITPDKWKYVPLQDFTTTSDIDWSKTVAEIDRQLYAKYGLDEKEIEFIETHVKEMT